ncbi:hypothetical protein PC116_g31491 [Phytophthora cactorum]|nr:hypothetical protein PC116_g31491 [Phytophthora cactorum]
MADRGAVTTRVIGVGTRKSFHLRLHRRMVKATGLLGNHLFLQDRHHPFRGTDTKDHYHLRPHLYLRVRQPTISRLVKAVQAAEAAILTGVDGVGEVAEGVEDEDNHFITLTECLTTSLGGPSSSSYSTNSSTPWPTTSDNPRRELTKLNMKHIDMGASCVPIQDQMLIADPLFFIYQAFTLYP